MALKTFILLMVWLVFPLAGTAKENPDHPRKLIIVGGNSAYPPYEFIDDAGKPAGFIVELTRALAQVMEFDVSIKPAKTKADMWRAFERGNVQVLENVSFSEERLNHLDFSTPHSFVSYSIFRRSGAVDVSSREDLAGKKVIVLGGGALHDSFAPSGKGFFPVSASTVEEALRMLSTGKYDYAILATLPAMYVLNNRKIDNVETAAKTIDTKKYCFAVRKGDRALLAKFDEGLALLKETGRYRELQEKWFGNADAGTRRISWPVRHGLIVVGLLGAALIIFIVWSQMLKYQVAARTAALEQEVEEGKRTLEKLKSHQQQLIHADKMAALGAVVSGMAHEINSPNSLILSNLPSINEVLKDVFPILDEYRKKHGDFPVGGIPYSRMRGELPVLLDEMQDAAKRIKRILEDLGDYAGESAAGARDLVDMNEVVRTALRLVDNSLRRPVVNYRVYYAKNLPPVKGNQRRLEQALVNLMLNACRTMDGMNRQSTTSSNSFPLAGLLASVEPGEFYQRDIFVTTSYQRNSDTVLVKVRDRGRGIRSEPISLTDPFLTSNHGTGSTGPGLAIASEIIREHNGSIRFDSQVGQGATVTVELPTAERESPSGS